MEPNNRVKGVSAVHQLAEAAIAEPELVEAATAATADAGFADFYRDSRDGLVRAVAMTIADRDLAIEAVDEAFARAYPRWGRVGRLESPGGWVFRVALNWATSVLRRRRRAPKPLSEDDHTDIGPVGEPDVLVALGELDVPQRAVVVCRHLLGWSEAQTAAALGIPRGTVKSRLHRATRYLAVRLDHLRPSADDNQ